MINKRTYKEKLREYAQKNTKTHTFKRGDRIGKVRRTSTYGTGGPHNVSAIVCVSSRRCTGRWALP